MNLLKRFLSGLSYISPRRSGLVFLLLALLLSLVWLSPAAAADGALDLTFNMGSDQVGFAGVQNIPLIKGQIGYPTDPNKNPWPYDGYNLVFGTFWGLTVTGSNPPTQNHSCIARLTNTGALDSTFVNNQNSTTNLSGEIRGAYIYPYNHPAFPYKILIWGRFFASVNTGSTTLYYNNLARLNADGSLDPSFPVLNSYDGAVNTVALQGPDGIAPGGTTTYFNDKIYVGGFNLKAASTEDGPTYQLVRLNYDGTPDTGFTHWGAPNAYINGIRVYVGDPTFGNDVRIWGFYPKNQDGSGGYYYMLLVDANVNLPSTLTPPLASMGEELADGPILNMAKESGGKWVIGGNFKKIYDAAHPSGYPENRVARLFPDLKTLDTTYDVGSGPDGTVTQISPMKAVTNPPSYDDRMVLTGSFTSCNGTPCGYIVRLNNLGAVDTTFNVGAGSGADDRIWRLNWKNDGTGGWIYGYFRNYNSGGTNYARGGIAGLDANGFITSSFGNVTANAGWPGMVYSLARQNDGKILIGGDFNGVCGKWRQCLARINPDGSLDTSFKGYVDGIVNSVAVQADGKILVGGAFGYCQVYPCTSLARLNPDGSLDATFKPMLVDLGGSNSLNSLRHVVPLSNGQIMVAGDIYNSTGSTPLARLNSDGSLDAAFFANISNIHINIPGVNWVYGSRIALAGSKYVIAGGSYTNTPGVTVGILGRVNQDGTLDTSFAPGASVANVLTMDGLVEDMLLQPDGKVVVSGAFANVNNGSGSSTARRAIARYSADGLLDGTFTPNLTIPPSASGANTIDLAAMALQPNGKILIEENFLNVSGWNWNYLGSQVARLNPNGSLDPTFSLGTPANGWFNPGGGNSILRLSNGKALIGGVFSMYSGTPEFSLVRIFAGPANSGSAIPLLLFD